MADQTFSKVKLSGSTDGKNIKIAATATPGTLIHTASAVADVLDEVWLWLVNTSTSPVKVTLEWGEATAPDGNVEVTVSGENGAALVIPGWLLANGLTVKAFAGTANVVTANGYVNRITG